MLSKYFIIGVYLAGASLLAQSELQSTPTMEERNKAIAMRVFEEILNQGRFEVANEIYSPDFQNHGFHRTVDLKTDQDAAHAEKQAFPDMRLQVERLIAEGDWVTALWTFRGTHTAGGYGSLPATGTPIEMRGITIWRIVDGKIREEWSSFDQLVAYSQVVHHVQGKLWIAFGVFLVLVVAAERLLWAGCKWLVKLFRHKPSQA
jgi:predicted ester cyclase